MNTPGRVGSTAFLLGLAGLLPQLAAALIVVHGGQWVAYGMAFAITYASIILSFLGGIWWGFAVNRTAGGAKLAALAVAPSLIAVGVVSGGMFADKVGVFHETAQSWQATVLGLALLATVAVDARLEHVGDAPLGWTRFRVALSLGLGVLTMATGWLYATQVQTVILY